MSFRRQFLKNVFVSGSYTFLAQFISFLGSLVTARLLLPADFGIVGLITVFSNFISVFSDSGISYAIIRSNYRNTYYRGLHVVSILIGISLCVLFLILIYPISVFYKNINLLLPGIAISVLFIARSINIVPIAIYQKEMRFNKAGRATFAGAFAGIIATIIFAFSGWGYWALIWSQFINSITTTALIYKSPVLKFEKVKKPVVVKSFGLARSLIGNLSGFNMINYWARNADNLIVGKYYNTNDLGIYGRAYMLLLLPLALITQIFSSVLLPSLVKHKNEGQDVRKEYTFSLKVISLLNLPVGLVLILFSDVLVKILWGNNWLAVAKLLPYFGLLVFTQTLFSTSGSILVLESREKLMMHAGWISALIMIAGIIFGSTISLTGIAAFYSLSYLVLVLPFNIIYVFGYRLKYDMNFLIFWIPKLIVSLIIWIGIYFNYPVLLLLSLAFWVLLILWDTRKELKTVAFILKKDTYFTAR